MRLLLSAALRHQVFSKPALERTQASQKTRSRTRPVLCKSATSDGRTPEMLTNTNRRSALTAAVTASTALYGTPESTRINEWQTFRPWIKGSLDRISFLDRFLLSSTIVDGIFECTEYAGALAGPIIPPALADGIKDLPGSESATGCVLSSGVYYQG
eukprot:2991537-Pyramimonas_sp.AAC.1